MDATKMNHESQLLDCPLRPVDWRWQSAQLLAAPGPGRKPKGQQPVTDPFVLAAAQYLRADRNPVEMTADVHLAEQAEKLAATKHICRLQARLLSGMPLDHVAALEDIKPTVVRWYAALFFDVLDCLAAHDYILLQAVGLGPDLRTPPGQEALVKLLAYTGGPLVLDVLLAVLGWAPASPGLDPALWAAMRALILVHTTPAKDQLLGAKVMCDRSLLSCSSDALSGGLKATLRELTIIDERKSRLEPASSAHPAGSAVQTGASAERSPLRTCQVA